MLPQSCAALSASRHEQGRIGTVSLLRYSSQLTRVQVLQPEQAAVLLITAHPANVDALALINTLAAPA